MTDALRNKHLCVHGHFYQPPRENPWHGAVDPEESAHPYRDWNSKVFAECYGPNAACPVTNAAGAIDEMADNYRKISFDFGASLLSWLESERPAFYRALLGADQESARERGHGNAVALPYFHAILPLQTLAEKRTLVRWGLQDFEARFGRPAEGLWLPETAVDEETLEVVAEAGLRFTVLAPHQAARVRDLGGEAAWKDVTHETLLPTRPYRWCSKAQPGRGLAVFFYHQLLSESVVTGEAFEGPETLLKKVLGRFFPNDSTQLVSLANDGEFYGHHHRRGHEALAGALRLFELEGGTLANYAQFLDQFPPPQEVEINPGTSWSCEHGLGRWREDCGCRSPRRKGWSQAWRAPLRAALADLGSACDQVYAKNAGNYLKDFRAAREAYGRRTPSPASAAEFLAAHGLPGLAFEESVKALKLLEMVRERLAMFTSCGWFFDDISGLEAVLCLSRAARAAELAAEFGEDPSPALLEALARAPSNLKRLEDGKTVMERLVLPQRADLRRLAAHAAILEHLGASEARPRSGVSARVLAWERRSRPGLAGRDRSFSALRLEVTRLSTLERAEVLAAVLQKDRLELAAWVSADASAAPGELCALFETAKPEAFERALVERVGGEPLGLDALFPEERREVLRLLTPFPFRPREREEFLKSWKEAVCRLRREGGSGEDVLGLLEACPGLKLRPDQLPWAAELRRHVARLLGSLSERGGGEKSLSLALRWVRACEDSGLAVDLWELQHLFWLWRGRLLAAEVPPFEREAAMALGEKLGFSDLALMPLARAETSRP